MGTEQGVKSVVEAYPYFFANIFVIVLIFLGAMNLPKRHRGMLFFSGLAGVPCFPFIVLLEGFYWSPVRIGGVALGLEDAICSFAVGSLSWLAAAWPLQRDLKLSLEPYSYLWRYPALGGATVAFFLLLWLIGIGPMTCLVLTYVVVGLVLLTIRRDLWPLSLTGMTLFPPLYLLLVKMFFWVWPHFPSQWNPSGVWGSTILDVPLGEVSWSFVFGAFWPLFVAFVFEVRLGETTEAPSRNGAQDAHSG